MLALCVGRTYLTNAGNSYGLGAQDKIVSRIFFVNANKECKAMIHIGQQIRKEVEERGKTSVWLARELGCHRTNVYKIYDKPTIDTGVLLRISRILHVDFFEYYSAEIDSKL
jgi:hypothetical protein